MGTRRILLTFVLLAAASLVTLACGGGGGPSSASQEISSSGGTVSLGDSVTLRFPPNALSETTTVTISSESDGGPSADEFDVAYSVGEAYVIDLGGAELSGPVTLEIAYDPDSLPEGMTDEEVFLAFYDEELAEWVPVGGRVDAERGVIVVDTEHLSWWNPFTWNWGAWLAVLQQTLSLRLSEWLDAVELLTTECERSGEHASVDESGANNVIQGCITKDDPANPEFRVVNVKSFFLGISPAPDGPGYPEATILGPGDSAQFTADASDLPPALVYADFTEEAMWRFIAGLVARMLPAGDQIPNEGLAFLADGLPRVVNAAEVIEAWEARDASGLADAIFALITGDEFIQTFAELAAQYGEEHGMDMLGRWTTSGIRQVLLGVAAVDVIVSVTDFVANYFFNNRSEVGFGWSHVNPITVEQMVAGVLGALRSIPGASAGVDAYETYAVRDHHDPKLRPGVALPDEIRSAVDWVTMPIVNGVTGVPAAASIHLVASPAAEAAKHVRVLACQYPENESLTEAWFLIRDFMTAQVRAMVQAGVGTASNADRYLENSFSDPPGPGCS